MPRTNYPPLMPTYNRFNVAFERGEGMYLYDGAGKRYLDFYAGIAVSAFGHCHPVLVKALQDQAAKLWHVSNMFRIPGQERLAEKLAGATCADSVFFVNSGVEAIECALKLARRFHHDQGNPQRYRVITFRDAFHGRSLAAISAAKKEKMTEGFGPMLEGFDNVPFLDLEAARTAITDETAAFLIEPVQGEGGIRPARDEDLRALRELADEHDLLLIVDEIQCGMGRTGKLFAHEWAGVEPDIIAAAKGIGGGFPFGACLAKGRVGQSLSIGTHGTTYGGNPLAMAVGEAVFDLMARDGFLDHVLEMAGVLRDGLQALAEKYPGLIVEVRGRGLMLGMECARPVRPILEDLVSNGLLCAAAGPNVLRFLPPLIVEKDHIGEMISILDPALARAAESGNSD